MIQSILRIFIGLLPLLCWNCSDPDTQAGVGAPAIESFALRCGNTEYRGTIDPEKKEIRIGGIDRAKKITGATCTLSEGSVVSPDPGTVARWERTQVFTVTHAASGQSAAYTVLLPDLAEEARPVVVGYMPLNDWEFSDRFPHIRWDCLTRINVCFARVKADGSLDLERVKDRLPAVTAKAREEGVEVLISLSKRNAGEFAAAVNDPAARSALVGNILSFVRENGLDGFDIDYEEYDDWNARFPGLLAFVRELREAKDPDMLMTCAVVSRWLNYTEAWHTYFDYIHVMSYDKGVYTDTPAQHASYDDFVKDLEYWVGTFRAPESKLVGGLPFYGYSWDEGVPADEVRAIRFHSILTCFGPEAADLDQVSETYYNGRPTIRKKCRYVTERGFAGVMIWQLFQDAHDDGLKLIETVGREMAP